MRFRKYSFIISLLGLSILVVFGLALASDPPHTTPEGIGCSSCHVMHSQFGNSQGPSLTKASNANLCMNNCHSIGGVASNWPFSPTDQAAPGVSGTSHRWDGTMPATSNANNQYGLRSAADVKNPAIVRMLNKFGSCSVSTCYTQPTCVTAGSACLGGAQSGTWTSGVVCSTCHQQHNQIATPYDAYSYNSSNGDPGGTDTTSTCSSTTTLTDSNKTWSVNQWNYYTLVITGPSSSANVGQSRTISATSASSVTVSSAFPACLYGNTYYIVKNGSTWDSGTATGGSQTTLIDTTKSANTAWSTVNAWVGYYVKMIGGLCNGQRRHVTAYNNATFTLTVDSFDACNVSAGDPYYITSGRHYMRANNALDDMCVDCHYYRSAAVTQTNVETWDGNEKSHPVGKNLSQYDPTNNPNGVKDATQFNSTPLEPASQSWAAQTGTRYEQNAIAYCSNSAYSSQSACVTAGATWYPANWNITGNINVGIDGKIGCLSCHNVHYSDSNSSTVDTPSGYAP